MRLHGRPDDQINILVPRTPDEIEAQEENEVLARGTPVMINADDDHLSHMVIHDKMEKTPAVVAHMQAHKRAFKQLGQQQKVQEQQALAQEGKSAISAQAQAQRSAQVANRSQASPQSVNNASGV